MSPDESSGTPLSRRQLLVASGWVLAGLAGCTGDSPGRSGEKPSPPTSPTGSHTTPEEDPSTPSVSPGPPSSDTPSPTENADSPPGIASVAVSDFVLYALAGTHPHVHRAANTQYLLLRLETPRSFDDVVDGLTVELDDEPVELAERQPVPWRNETLDLAFAVAKDRSYQRGHLLFDGTELRSLSETMIERLDRPPVFEVSSPEVDPAEIGAGEVATATVRFDLANTGEGPGTFGASLSGNYLSGSNTITATLEPGETREVTGRTEIVGEGDAATVRLDWGSDGWVGSVRVVGTPTETDERTPSV